MMAHPPSFRTTVQTEYVHWYELSDKDATLAQDEQESNCSNLLLSFQKSNTKRQICGGWCSSDLLDNIEVVSSLEVNDNVSVPPLDALSHAKHIRAEVYQTLILQKASIYNLVVWNYICFPNSRHSWKPRTCVSFLGLFSSEDSGTPGIIL